MINLYVSDYQPIETLTYFPEDNLDTFISSETNLKLLDNKELLWTTSSMTKEDPYLRQDVSLLYVNGQFKGVVNLWKQSEKQLFQEKKIPLENDELYETITFHHSEIHRNENDITSIQQMSHDQLFVYKLNGTNYTSFHQPANEIEEKIKNKFSNKTNKSLHLKWQSLINHFNIDQRKYELIPLTELYQYNKKPLASLSDKETNRVIGQLWEGLYKNYIIPITTNHHDSSSHVIPLILIDKNNTHLYVLYELNGKEFILKQNI